MAICIPKPISDKIKSALKGKDFTISNLFNMKNGDERIKFLEKYAGKSATDINALFESRFLLKNQYIGFKNFIDRITASGRYSPEKIAELKKSAELLKQQKFERIFNPKQGETILTSAVEKIVGSKLTDEQISNIYKLTVSADELRKGFDDTANQWISDKQKADYGSAKVILENYIQELKTGKMTLKEMLAERWGKFKAEPNKPKAVADLIIDTLKVISDNSISLVATFDNSFMGRQGLKTLITHPKIWWNMAKNSFSDIYKTLGGKNARDALWADIYSSPNYLNGSYDIAKLIPATEEQFPTSIPTKIPVLGRAFLASENAFTGSAIRSRTDLFDLLADKAKKNGVDMTDKYQIQSIGKLVSSLTARGQWGKRGEPAIVRLILWAPKMLKANIDVLTGHLGQDISPFARKQAATNLLKIVGTTAMVMMVANAMKPGSAETDPRSSDFGKIKIGNTRFDFTGGAASLIVLASRLISNSTKSSTTGMVSQFGTGYGQTSKFDILTDFLTGKTTPPMRVLVDWLKGRNFQGQTPTIPSSLYSVITPISIQNAVQLKDDNSVQAVLGTILDVLGINANTYQPYQTDWSTSTGKELTAFNAKVGPVKFAEANKLYNKTYNDWYNGVKINPRFQTLDDATKLKVITNKKSEIKTQIFRQYGFRYVATPSKPVPKF
jgi:hypothetical protein